MAYPSIIALTPQSKHHTTIGPVKLDKQFLAEKMMRAGGYYSLQLKTIKISWKPLKLAKILKEELIQCNNENFCEDFTNSWGGNNHIMKIFWNSYIIIKASGRVTRNWELSFIGLMIYALIDEAKVNFCYYVETWTLIVLQCDSYLEVFLLNWPYCAQ